MWESMINMTFQIAYNLWKKWREAEGVDKVPEWSEIADKNARLQAEIDAEMG